MNDFTGKADVRAAASVIRGGISKIESKLEVRIDESKIRLIKNPDGSPRVTST
jgi:hypothetical protein